MIFDSFKSLIKTYTISAIILIVVLFLTFANFGDNGGYALFENADKVVHFCMYAAITLSLCYDSRNRVPYKGRKKVIAKCFATAVAFGIITELGQEFLTNYRSGDFFDFLADTAGAAVGAALSIPMFSILNKRTK